MDCMKNTIESKYISIHNQCEKCKKVIGCKYIKCYNCYIKDSGKIRIQNCADCGKECGTYIQCFKCNKKHSFIKQNIS